MENKVQIDQALVDTITKGNKFDSFWEKEEIDLIALIESLKKESDPLGLDITISINEEFTEWSYQTGDNSYTGGCYFHPYWGVSTIFPDSKAKEIAKELIDNLGDQISW